MRRAAILTSLLFFSLTIFGNAPNRAEEKTAADRSSRRCSDFWYKARNKIIADTVYEDDPIEFSRKNLPFKVRALREYPSDERIDTLYQASFQPAFGNDADMTIQKGSKVTTKIVKKPNDTIFIALPFPPSELGGCRF